MIIFRKNEQKSVSSLKSQIGEVVLSSKILSSSLISQPALNSSHSSAKICLSLSLLVMVNGQKFWALPGLALPV